MPNLSSGLIACANCPENLSMIVDLGNRGNKLKICRVIKLCFIQSQWKIGWANVDQEIDRM